MAKGIGDVPQKAWVALAIAVVILVFLLVIRKDVLRWLGADNPPPLQTEEEVDTQVDDLLDQAEVVDDSQVSPEFESTAMAVADAQYAELTSYSQDEYAMMAQLNQYDGAQLQQIFDAFGARLYDGGFFGDDTYMNLFGFYAEELDNSILYGQEITLDWDEVNPEWRPTDIEDCSGLITGGCTEKQAFRAIWWRSGLPLTF